jgi:hypothetical protein
MNGVAHLSWEGGPSGPCCRQARLEACCRGACIPAACAAGRQRWNRNLRGRWPAAGAGAPVHNGGHGRPPVSRCRPPVSQCRPPVSECRPPESLQATSESVQASSKPCCHSSGPRRLLAEDGTVDCCVAYIPRSGCGHLHPAIRPFARATVQRPMSLLVAALARGREWLEGDIRDTQGWRGVTKWDKGRVWDCPQR